jgi:hypothetical protein
MAQNAHYCHNCHVHGSLIDGAHCAFCAAFFYSHGRMPRKGEWFPQTGLEQLYEIMKWGVPRVRTFNCA